MYFSEGQLKNFILDSGLVSRDVYALAEKKAQVNGLNLSEVLLREGFLSDGELRRAKAHIAGIPYVDIKDYHLDLSVLALIPEPIARKHNIVSIKRAGSNIEVAMLDVEDLKAIDFLTNKLGLKVLPRFADVYSVRNALLVYQKLLKVEYGDDIKREISSIGCSYKDNSGGNKAKNTVLEASSSRILDIILKHSILQNATDIHIEPTEDALLIRYRIGAVLYDAMNLPKSIEESITARVKILSNLDLVEKKLPQDGRFNANIGTEMLSFRVLLLPVSYGEKIVIRILRDASSGFSLEVLGFHGDGLEDIHKAIRAGSGLFLVVGPEKSGKTTTLYTILDILNTPNINIGTIESPIDFLIKRINQTEVKPEIGLTFATGIKTLIRQDTDIIMVGDIREKETATSVINTASSGHLVFSAMEGDDACHAISKLEDMGIDKLAISVGLNAVISQKLVRKLHSKSEKYFLGDEQIKLLSNQVCLVRVLELLKSEGITDESNWVKIPFYRSQKSQQYQNSFDGSVVLFEVLTISPLIREMIKSSMGREEIEKQAIKDGMITMKEDGLFKAVQGLVTLEDVFGEDIFGT